MERARALFFDAHGVLYDRAQAYPRLHALLRQWGIAERTDAELRPAVEAVVRRAMIGQASEREVFLAYLDAYEVTEPERREDGCRAQAADHGDIRLIEGVIPTLRVLHARGLRLGVITDTVAATAEKLAWLRAAGLDLAWDSFANSREVGARKPDARIYQSALEQAGVRADEAVFVGHSARELAGARAVGMATVAFQPDPGAVADVTITRFADLLALPIMKTVGEMDNFLEVLAREFSAEEDTFLLKLRCDFVWDRDGFSRLTEAMLGCCRAYDLSDTRPILMDLTYDKERVPRWLAEGFWYLADFVPAHSSHPAFPRPYPSEYYEAAFCRLRDLAEWFFRGQSPYLMGHGFEPL